MAANREQPLQRFGVNEHLDIVQRCLEGDRKAQKQVYDMLAGKMLSLCLRYTGDNMTAQDMLQDGFVTLFSRLDTYKAEGSFEGWARRIFATTCLMHLRKKDALKMSGDLEEAEVLPEKEASQTQQLGYKELMRLILQMPDGYRAVFNLFAIEGFSHKEISQMLGISEVTSRSQFNRARSWLQKKIKEQEL